MPDGRSQLAGRPLLDYCGALAGYAVTTYEACDHRCTYCITAVQGRSVPRLARDEVATQLAAELADVPHGTHLAVGGVCDAYPNAERDYGVSRAAIETLIAHRRGFRIITKGDTVLRDLDLLVGYPLCGITVSLCSVDQDRLDAVDPNVPSAARRLEMIDVIDAAGVDVEVSAAPWIPDVTDAEAIVAAVPSHLIVRFAALRVMDPHIVHSRFARRFDQAEINAAYSAAQQARDWPSNVFWSPPPEVSGQVPNVYFLMGKRTGGELPERASSYSDA